MESANSTVPNAKTVAPVRKKTVKIVFKFLIGLALIPVLLTAYFYIGGIEWGDWTIPDEAELRLEVRELPDEDNAYVALTALTNICTVVHDDKGSGDGEKSERMSDKDFAFYYGKAFPEGDGEERAKWEAVRNDPDSPKRAARILADNAKFFEGFRTALALGGFREKEVEWPTDFPPMVRPLPLYGHFISFTKLVKLKVQVALEHGDLASAVSDIGDMHALGQMFSTNCTSLVGYLVGDLIEKMSYEKMCDAIAMGKVSGEAIERFSKMVERSEAHAQLSWERAIKAELALNVKTDEWFCNLPDNNFNIKWPESYEADSSAKWEIEKFEKYIRKYNWWPGLFRFCFHRREMIFRKAEAFRSMLAHEEPKLEFDGKWWMAFLPNGIGRLHGDALMPLFEPFFQRCSLNRIRIRLVIAAEKWRRAHGGKNPPTLNALVPDYLALVPKDPWSKSGEPIKYDASTGVAWSVGKDGTYDYRKIAKDHAAGSKASVDVGTQAYAFRLDGKPINNETNNAGGAKHQASPLIRKDDSTSTTQTQYAAEAIPVLGNLRTKIGLYQYEKDILPCIVTNEVANGEDTGRVISPQIETWVPADRGTVADVSANSPKAHVYKMASSALPSDEPPLKGLAVFDSAKGLDVESRHLGVLVDIDPLDLLGKYSRPNDYQYLVMRNGKDYVYFIGCFGDGNGLPAGTGYAVCEISSLSTGRKYIGFWERYRSTGDTQICFTSGTSSKDGHALGCYVPEKSTFDNMTKKDMLREIIGTMKRHGWDFGDGESERPH